MMCWTFLVLQLLISATEDTSAVPRMDSPCEVPKLGSAHIMEYRRGGGYISSLPQVPAGTQLLDKNNPFLVCKEGYEYEGRSYIPLSCSDGQWDPPKLWCEGNPCRKLPEVKNAQIIGPVPHGQELEYKCNPGYRLIRSGSTPHCWLGEVFGTLPKCHQTPPRPHEGAQRRGGHDTNTYRPGEDPNEIGISAKGSQLRTCKFPERRRHLYAADGNVRVLPNDNVTHGTVLRFHCRPLGELRLVGNESSQCINGTWSNEVPYCYEPDIYDVVIGLKDTAGTAVSPDGYLNIDPGFEVEMACKSYRFYPRLEMSEPVSSWKRGDERYLREFRLVSAKFILPDDYEGIIRCSNNIKHGPQIIKIRGRYLRSCKIPAHLDATVVTRVNKEIVTVGCKPPYVLRGEAKAVCLAHSEWEKPFPECVLPAPSNISSEHGNVTMQSAKPVPERTTQIPRMKEPSNPKCKVLPIENGLYQSNVNTSSPEIQPDKEFANGTSIYFHCRGDRTSYKIRCLEGFWKPAPRCPPEEHTCDVNNVLSRVPPEVVIGANASEVAAGTVYHAFCKNTGYTFEGLSRVICNADGTWSFDASMRCVKGCPNFADKDETLIIEGILPAYHLGDSITLSCPGGTELYPPVERIICLGDGWSETKLPRCRDSFSFYF